MVEGLWLMLVGMSSVFAFLAILVTAMNISSWFIINYLPDDLEEDSGQGRESFVRLAIALAAIESKKREGTS
jgi:Na+-transporting methylmalonyl-CoA/oxaloacetate decarboxylase gamma subunit